MSGGMSGMLVAFEDLVTHRKMGWIDIAAAGIPEPPADWEASYAYDRDVKRWLTESETDERMSGEDSPSIWLRDYTAPQVIPGAADCSECRQTIPTGTWAVQVSGALDPNGELWAHVDCYRQCSICGMVVAKEWTLTDDDEIMCPRCVETTCECGHRAAEHIPVQDGDRRGTNGECGHITDVSVQCQCRLFRSLQFAATCPFCGHIMPLPYKADALTNVVKCLAKQCTGRYEYSMDELMDYYTAYPDDLPKCVQCERAIEPNETRYADLNNEEGTPALYHCEGCWLGRARDKRTTGSLGAWDLLHDPYVKWCESEGLPVESADELLYRDTLTKYQRKWLAAFTMLWNVMENRRGSMPTNLNNERAVQGRALLAKYIRLAGLDAVEAGEDYTVTDAILALMHHAGKRGIDAIRLANSAIGRYETETTVCEVCGVVGSPDEHECKGVAAHAS